MKMTWKIVLLIALTEAFGKTFAGCLKEAIVNAVLCQD